MRIYVAGKEIFLCPNCRAIWGDWRYGFAKKHGSLSHSAKYMSEIRKLFELFCSTRKEKVQFT